MKIKSIFLIGLTAVAVSCTSEKKVYKSFDEYPVPSAPINEMVYTPSQTTFTLWAPTAEQVELMLFESGEEGSAYQSVTLEAGEDGLWSSTVKENLKGKFYAFNVKIKEKWLGETPGIMAKAVGVNGKRAAIIDMQETDPQGWASDKRPPLKSDADIILYEMHHRDFSMDTTSGIKNRGKFLALTEKGTKNSAGDATGIDHLKELGITHVHLLPSFDFASIDETELKKNKYNWGYDPQNYNVPEGSYSTNPKEPATRIIEFKKMVESLHKAGIRVVMDVVYNHTAGVDNSNFELTVPGYFYRKKANGKLANGSGCGNETASERGMMRKFMIESVVYWATEYHVDGFRFDLMGIHDIETMNQIRAALDKVDPSIYVYGEGWAAQEPQLPKTKLAMKENINRMPRIAAFSDELRDALRGPFNDDQKGGFMTGVPGKEMSVMFGLVGAIKHPQIINDSVNYSKAPWALQPTQMISYVSCHDDMCLADRIKSSVPDASPLMIANIDKLAITAVLTSQGVPFIFAGDEILRDKKLVHNSFNSPDDVNAINWSNKTLYRDVFAYYKGMIALRKAHPAFHMGDAEMVRKHMEFLPVAGSNLIVFRLKGYANGDSWEEIFVALNGDRAPRKFTIEPGKYTVVCKNGLVNQYGLGTMYGGEVYVPGQSALIFHK
ncbi:type I pullulanase [uncultured Bacteroides sp.]|uniref:type I pullulanase n=1 Tax=uncultured Bacteroides sp. TaxID=162156 RepID=UPI002AAB04EE|nr:type I pullulanase [uncultured Bacteroides sp.]